MPCTNSVITPSGNFTFHSELLTKCEAVEKCRQNGRMLAPITNKNDVNILMKAVRSNDLDCDVNSGDFTHYWVGLDVGEDGRKRFHNGEIFR